MSAAVHSVELFLFAGLSFLLLGSLASAALARLGARRIARLEPSTRHRALVLLAALPLLIALALLFSASLPSLIGLALPARDHCLTHDDHHVHLCFVHLPQLGASSGLLLSLVFPLAYAAIRAGLSLVMLLRASRLVRALTDTGVRRADLDATLLESTHAICLTAGLVHPAVLISRGLLETLDDSERLIVLAHEHEHVSRKDALIAGFVRACGIVHVASVARWLARETEIAAEQACDEAAGAAVGGDRAAVAATLLKVERAAGSQRLGALAVGAGTCAIERRVEALLAEPRPAGSLRWVYGGFVVALGTMLFAADAVHHATESLLSLLLH